MKNIDNYYYFENEKVNNNVTKILKSGYDIVQFKFERKYSTWTVYGFDERNIAFFSTKVIEAFMSQKFLTDINDIRKKDLIKFCKVSDFTCINVPMQPFVKDFNNVKSDSNEHTIVFVSDCIRGTGGINQLYSNLAEVFHKNGYDVRLWGIFDKQMKEERIPSEKLFYYTDNVYYAPNVEKLKKEVANYKSPIFIISSSTIYSSLIDHIQDHIIINHYLSSISTLLKNFYYEPTRFNGIEKFISDGYPRDMLLMMSKTEAKYMKNISIGDVECVYNYTPIVEKEKITNTKKDIVWSGRMHAKAKNFEDVIKLALKIKEENFNVLLHVYSSKEDEILEKIKKLGIEDVLILHDFTSDKSEIYADKKILILTSLYEGNPMVINEAVQFKVIPVLYRSCFFIDEFFLNDPSQYVVNDVDSMFMAIKDIIENDKQFVEPNVPIFTESEIITEWNKIFTKAINNRKNRLFLQPSDQISQLKEEIKLIEEKTK